MDGELGYCVSDGQNGVPLFTKCQHVKCHDLGFIYYMTLFVHGALDSRELSRYDFVYVVGHYRIDLGPIYDSYFDRVDEKLFELTAMIMI